MNTANLTDFPKETLQWIACKIIEDKTDINDFITACKKLELHDGLMKEPIAKRESKLQFLRELECQVYNAIDVVSNNEIIQSN